MSTYADIDPDVDVIFSDPSTEWILYVFCTLGVCNCEQIKLRFDEVIRHHSFAN